MSEETIIEMSRYQAKELREDILDMVEWAAEDGLSWWEIYGVISSVEKYLELVFKSDILIQAKDIPD